MFNHARGAANGRATDESGYVSTTSDRAVALGFVQRQGGTGFIYEIVATLNFVDVQGTLLEWNPYPEEREFAALGGINWEQVITYQEYTGGRAGPITTNPDYNPRFNRAAATTSGEPRLAGFDAAHPAWRAAPWNVFAPGGCGGLPRSHRSPSLDKRQAQTCDNFNQLFAERFMDENCLAQQCG